jgi:hypothetical protein
LYRTKTFPGLKNAIHVIDETDFKGTICGTRYWIIDHYLNGGNLIGRRKVSEIRKVRDFCYYGCDKSKDVDGVKSYDERADILKQIFRDTNIDSFFIGRFKGFTPQMKWQKMKDVIPSLVESRATLCFNWPGFSRYPTSRYAEALACSSIPLVWKDYDINNTVVCDQWQRCNDYSELVSKLKEIRDPKVFCDRYESILNTYLTSKILSKTEYYAEVKNKINCIVQSNLIV